MLAACLFCAPLEANAQLDCGRRFVFGDVQTDFRPGRDFQRVQVVLVNLNDPLETYSREVAVDPSADYRVGQRVLEQCVEGPDEDVNTYDYALRVDLLREDWSRVGTCRYDARWINRDHAMALGCTIAAPDGHAEKTVRLLHDVDGDGQATAGDVLRYTVRIDSPKAGSFRDFLGAGSRLVSGTVTSSHGHVQYGNGPGDEAVVVGDLLLAREGQTIEIEFDAFVDYGVIGNQGEVFLVGLEDTTDLLRTDDPESPLGGSQPTEIRIHCAQDGQDGLAQCEAERAALQAQLDDRNEAIFALAADDDADTVIAVRDDCPDTARSAAVDRDGCSAAQFCATVDAGTRLGRRTCKRSDWGNDEPLARRPRDCTVRGGLCVAAE